MAATPSARRAFQSWFPPAFFALVALGTLPVIFTNLFVPTPSATPAAAALFGREYAAVQLPAFDRNPLLIHAHAVVGLAVVLLAPFQFWRGFRNRHRELHRRMGYALVSCLVTLATSGLAVAIVYRFARTAGVIPNFIWMVAILATTGLAIAAIRERNILAHETWMARAMAITLGITFASLYIPVLTLGFGVQSRAALAISFWLGVGESLAVVELWLRRPGRPGLPHRP